MNIRQRFGPVDDFGCHLVPLLVLELVLLSMLINDRRVFWPVLLEQQSWRALVHLEHESRRFDLLDSALAESLSVVRDLLIIKLLLQLLSVFDFSESATLRTSSVSVATVHPARDLQPLPSCGAQWRDLGSETSCIPSGRSHALLPLAYTLVMSEQGLTTQGSAISR